MKYMGSEADSDRSRKWLEQHPEWRYLMAVLLIFLLCLNIGLF